MKNTENGGRAMVIYFNGIKSWVIEGGLFKKRGGGTEKGLGHRLHWWTCHKSHLEGEDHENKKVKNEAKQVKGNKKKGKKKTDSKGERETTTRVHERDG